MVVYGVRVYGIYQTFDHVTYDLEYAKVDPDVELVPLAYTDTHVQARYITDYLSYCYTNCSIYQSPSAYGIDDSYKLSAEGRAIWPVEMIQT